MIIYSNPSSGSLWVGGHASIHTSHMYCNTTCPISQIPSKGDLLTYIISEQCTPKRTRNPVIQCFKKEEKVPFTDKEPPVTKVGDTHDLFVTVGLP